MTNSVTPPKLFILNSLAIKSAVLGLQRDLNIDLGHEALETRSERTSLRNHFTTPLVEEAMLMAEHYVAFYCLENFMRRLIEEQFIVAVNGTIESSEDQSGDINTDWWENKVPVDLRKEAEQRRDQEIESGVTVRSDNMLDYLTFGELSKLIESNWKDVFESSFIDLKGLKRVMADLNRLRSPIAHCCLMPDDEVSRLNLAIRDLIRLV